MTSFAIAQGRNMTGTGPRGGRDWSSWRAVVVAWTVAGVLASALLLSVPHRDAQTPPARVWSLSHAGGGHVHKRGPDAEGPTGEESCSDRDYANELC